MTLNMSDLCTTNYNYTNSNCSFTSDQINNYCNLKLVWNLVAIDLDLTIGYSMIIAGLVGMIGTLCMCVTFWQSSCSSPSYLFYKAVSVIELIHMVVLIEYGIIRCLHFPPSGGMRMWDQAFAFGWSFGDWVKLSVAALTVVISIERCMAIWAPLTFMAIDRRRAAFICIAMSIAVGAIQMFTLVLYVMSLSVGYTERFQETFAIMQNAIGYIKIIICLILAPITAAILVGLWMKSRRTAALTSNNAKSDEAWSTLKRLCYLQLILSVSTLVDHSAWFSYRMLSLLNETANLNVRSYEDLMTVFRYTKLMNCVEVVQVLTGEFLHCGKFYLYLLLHKSFRRTFLKLFRKGSVEQKTASNLIAASQVTRIIHVSSFQ